MQVQIVLLASPPVGSLGVRPPRSGAWVGEPLHLLQSSWPQTISGHSLLKGRVARSGPKTKVRNCTNSSAGTAGTEAIRSPNSDLPRPCFQPGGTTVRRANRKLSSVSKFLNATFPTPVLRRATPPSRDGDLESNPDTFARHSGSPGCSARTWAQTLSKHLTDTLLPVVARKTARGKELLAGQRASLKAAA